MPHKGKKRSCVYTKHHLGSILLETALEDPHVGPAWGNKSNAHDRHMYPEPDTFMLRTLILPMAYPTVLCLPSAPNDPEPAPGLGSVRVRYRATRSAADRVQPTSRESINNAKRHVHCT